MFPWKPPIVLMVMQAVRGKGVKGNTLPTASALTVTVPGTAAMWEDTVTHFGRLPLSQVSLHPLYCCTDCLKLSIAKLPLPEAESSR